MNQSFYLSTILQYILKFIKFNLNLLKFLQENNSKIRFI